MILRLKFTPRIKANHDIWVWILVRGWDGDAGIISFLVPVSQSDLSNTDLSLKLDRTSRGARKPPEINNGLDEEWKSLSPDCRGGNCQIPEQKR